MQNCTPFYWRFFQVRNISKALMALASHCLLMACTTAGAKGPISRDIDWPYERFVVNQEFGLTQYAREYSDGRHWGIDISHGDGASVRPIADGRIVAVGTDHCANVPDSHCNAGQGNWILIDHPQLGLRSFYGHLAEKPNLNINQWVTRDDVVGREGRSGKLFNLDGSLADASSPTHLHLSVGDIRAQTDSQGKATIAIGKIQDPRMILPGVSKFGR